jgi:Pvc16 N-terminal domain
MSNYLAFATVTETLRFLLSNAISPVLGGATVTTGKPTQAAAGDGTPRVNLYLYQVAPNTHWANLDVPTRDGGGRLVQKPRSAFDLHYLVTFYGEDATQDGQQLLGLVVRTLHAQPLLTRDLIDATIAANGRLAASDLARDVELVRFTPTRLLLEELSKLWSLFPELNYELSLAYQGSVVFIEADDVPVAVLPVLERNVYVVPLRDPAITQVSALQDKGPPIAFGPPIVRGSELVISGRQLRGPAPATTTLLIDGRGVDPRNADVALSIADGQITLRLEGTLPAPVPGLPLAVGTHRVQVRQQIPMGRGSPPPPHTGFESSLAAFVLQPQIGPITVTGQGGSGQQKRSATLTFEVDPPLASGDVARLSLIALADGSTYSFATTGSARQLQAAVSGVDAGDHYVRVTVNGVDSPLTRDQDRGSPTHGLWSGPRVTLP